MFCKRLALQSKRGDTCRQHFSKAPLGAGQKSHQHRHQSRSMCSPVTQSPSVERSPVTDVLKHPSHVLAQTEAPTSLPLRTHRIPQLASRLCILHRRVYSRATHCIFPAARAARGHLCRLPLCQAQHLSGQVRHKLVPQMASTPRRQAPTSPQSA
jgi:hypothetical protein